jgi:hypothetical protein
MNRLLRPYALAIAALLATITTTSAATVVETGGNNSQATAQFISAGSFTTTFSSIVTDSTIVPHATIQATGDGSAADWFSFYHGGGRLILDIDGAAPAFDSIISLWSSLGTRIAVNDDATQDPGSLNGLDSFINRSDQSSGLYFVAVTKFFTNFTDLNNFGISSSGFTSTGYLLHISSEGAGLSAIPEPGGILALGCLFGMGLTIRARRKNG